MLCSSGAPSRQYLGLAVVAKKLSNNVGRDASNGRPEESDKSFTGIRLPRRAEAIAPAVEAHFT